MVRLSSYQLFESLNVGLSATSIPEADRLRIEVRKAQMLESK